MTDTINPIDVDKMTDEAFAAFASEDIIDREVLIRRYADYVEGSDHMSNPMDLDLNANIPDDDKYLAILSKPIVLARWQEITDEKTNAHSLRLSWSAEDAAQLPLLREALVNGVRKAIAYETAHWDLRQITSGAHPEIDTKAETDYSEIDKLIKKEDILNLAAKVGLDGMLEIEDSNKELFPSYIRCALATVEYKPEEHDGLTHVQYIVTELINSVLDTIDNVVKSSKVHKSTYEQLATDIWGMNNNLVDLIRLLHASFPDSGFDEAMTGWYEYLTNRDDEAILAEGSENDVPMEDPADGFNADLVHRRIHKMPFAMRGESLAGRVDAAMRRQLIIAHWSGGNDENGEYHKETFLRIDPKSVAYAYALAGVLASSTAVYNNVMMLQSGGKNWCCSPYTDITFDVAQLEDRDARNLGACVVEFIQLYEPYAKYNSIFDIASDMDITYSEVTEMCNKLVDAINDLNAEFFKWNVVYRCSQIHIDAVREYRAAVRCHEATAAGRAVAILSEAQALQMQWVAKILGFTNAEMDVSRQLKLCHDTLLGYETLYSFRKAHKLLRAFGPEFDQDGNLIDHGLSDDDSTEEKTTEEEDK